MVKKIISAIINAVSVALIACAVIVLVTVVLTKKGDTPQILGYSAFRVLTGSMEPTIPTDSMVVTKKVPPEEIEVGDVITYYSLNPEIDYASITHRVMEVHNDNGYLYFITKGDANPVVDEYEAPADNLIGKVVYHNSFLGKIVRLSTNPLIFIIFIIIPLVIILITNIAQTVQAAKELAREEEKEELERLKKLVEEKEAKVSAAEAASDAAKDATEEVAEEVKPAIDEDISGDGKNVE